MTDTKNLTAEEVFNLLCSALEHPLGLAFYLYQSKPDLIELKSITINKRNDTHSISLINALMLDAGFIKWYGIDTAQTNTTSSVIEDWYNLWLKEKTN